MNIPINYGKGHFDLTLPSGVEAHLIRKPRMPVLPDPEAAVLQALSAPVEARPLAREASGRGSACIVICDITRPVPNHLLLGPIIRTLLAAGLSPARITVLVATGLHRPNLGPELDELLGDPWVKQTVEVVNHDAGDDQAHLDLGPTPDGTPVKIDRRFAAADLKIVTGLVEPHFMAGYSGGRKVIAPGIAHRDTITTFHSHRFMAHPAADNCNLLGNPLHREQLAIAAKLGPVLAMNTVLDEDRRLAFVNFGDLLASHEAAIEFLQAYARVPVPTRYRTVVTSGAGYPLDATYYQTVKGMVAPLDILEPGGDLLILSECSQGLGSPEFQRAQSRLLEHGPARFLESLAAKPTADVDEWQTQMLLKALARGNLHLYSTGLTPRQHTLTGASRITSVEQALKASVTRQNKREIAIIPEGPYVIPYLSR